MLKVFQNLIIHVFAVIAIILVLPNAATISREEIFEFEKPPVIALEGGKYYISFASTARCDATVSIIDKNGTIIRHLASGVLGANAPLPFAKDSLSQRIEWDVTDDQGRPAPDSCRVRVSLGLKAEFERNILQDNYEIPRAGDGSFLVATTSNKDNYILGSHEFFEYPKLYTGRVYDSTGQYKRTFWPPSFKNIQRLANVANPRFEKTIWGDTVIVAGTFGPNFTYSQIFSMYSQEGVRNPVSTKSRPSYLPAATSGYALQFYNGYTHFRMAADRVREEIYIGPGCGVLRFNGATGTWDKTWFPAGEMNKMGDMHFGPDGLLYMRVGGYGYGQWVIRVDHDGNPVDFIGNGAGILPVTYWPGTTEQLYGGNGIPTALTNMNIMGLWTGLYAHARCSEFGLYVSPKGTILTPVTETDPVTYVHLWDKDGNKITDDAVGSTHMGNGAAMDAAGNIYSAMGENEPSDQTGFWGLDNLPFEAGSFGGHGCLVKYTAGQTYPYTPDWIFPGLSGLIVSGCNCNNIRNDMDYFARSWLLTNQLYSVSVLDANANLIVRLGRYGNIDDTEEDVLAGRDGLRFVWPRALCVSDNALYVADIMSRRILKAKLGYYKDVVLNLDNTPYNSAEIKTFAPSFILHQNKPNPFSSHTTISYFLPVDSKVTLIVYDLQGKMVRKLSETGQQQGMHNINFNTGGLANGIYIYELKAGRFMGRGRMIIMQ